MCDIWIPVAKGSVGLLSQFLLMCIWLWNDALGHNVSKYTNITMTLRTLRSTLSTTVTATTSGNDYSDR